MANIPGTWRRYTAVARIDDFSTTNHQYVYPGRARYTSTTSSMQHNHVHQRRTNRQDAFMVAGCETEHTCDMLHAAVGWETSANRNAERTGYCCPSGCEWADFEKSPTSC